LSYSVLLPATDSTTGVGEGDFHDLASDDEGETPLIEERFRNKYDFSLDMVRIVPNLSIL
jgi:hypothetical protein